MLNEASKTIASTNQNKKSIMSHITKLFFVRHGEVYNPESVFYGRLPFFQLSKNGISQAEETANFLASFSISAIFASPLLRARQTARIINQKHNLDLQISKLLNEVHTPYEHYPLEDIKKLNWDVYTNTNSTFEKPIDVFNRIQKFQQRIRRNYFGKQTVVVSHSDPILFQTLWIKNQPILPESKNHLNSIGLPIDYPTPASISIFTYESNELNEIPKFQYVSFQDNV